MYNFLKAANAAIQTEWAEKEKNNITFDQHDIPGIEDILQNYGVFINLFSRKPCHSDSYMTGLDYKQLDLFFEEIEVPEPLAKICLDYWLNNPNNQPPLREVALIWERKIK